MAACGAESWRHHGAGINGVASQPAGNISWRLSAAINSASMTGQLCISNEIISRRIGNNQSIISQQ